MEPMNRKSLAIAVVTASLLSCSALAAPPNADLTLRATDAFLNAPAQPLRFQDDAGGGHDEGLALYRADDVDGARAKWREASVLDPDNYVIHKQLWAIENPERFYGERVDMAWQKEQLAQGL